MKEFSFWRWTLAILSTLYLIPEAIFNAKLVQITGVTGFDPATLEQVEYFGRAVSGIGLSLLVAGLFGEKILSRLPRGQKPLAGIMVLTGFFLVFWPVMFVGQKLVVEKVFIESSTVEQRMIASGATILKSGMLEGTIQVDDIEFGERVEPTPANQTFFSVVGGLLLSLDSLLNTLEEQKYDLAQSHVLTRAPFEEMYAAYNSEVSDALDSAWSKYSSESERYQNSLINGPVQLKADLITEIDNGWASYQEAQNAFTTKEVEKIESRAVRIARAMELLIECPNKRTPERVRWCGEESSTARSYKRIMAELGVTDAIPYSYWLQDHEPPKKKNVLQKLLSGGTINLNPFSGGSNKGEVRYVSVSKDMEFYRMRYLGLAQVQQRFSDQYEYSFLIGSRNEFKADPITSIKARTAIHNKVRDRYQKEGVALPNNWQLPEDWSAEEVGMFDKFARLIVSDLADKIWSKKISEEGYGLEPSLGRIDFELSDDVQGSIQSRMEEAGRGEAYIDGIRAGWSKGEFSEKLYEPYVYRKTDELVRVLDASKADFEDGGKYAEQSKQAYRSMLIPPISMILSLFFVALTLILLPVKYLTLFDKKFPVIKKVAPYINIAAVAALLILPLLLLSNRFTEDTKGPVHVLLEEVEKDTNIVFGYLLNWGLHTQPEVLPIGTWLEDKTHIYSFISEPLTSLEVFDEFTGLKEGHVDISTAYLTVRVEQADARVRIMNIKPKYVDGMELTPGIYDIEISKPGYRTIRVEKIITAGEQTLEFNLTHAKN